MLCAADILLCVGDLLLCVGDLWQFVVDARRSVADAKRHVADRQRSVGDGYQYFAGRSPLRVDILTMVEDAFREAADFFYGTAGRRAAKLRFAVPLVNDRGSAADALLFMLFAGPAAARRGGGAAGFT